ncbi:unnamed protein product [Rotaria magnacalcarata]|uniref:Uncharacterized protein n=1 Tax=Rotaria magnacalcarata TaxID=392030 RepID=A0A815CU81_9BILA|nr:unnamed protein product [Rotaria magnacalcarata]
MRLYFFSGLTTSCNTLKFDSLKLHNETSNHVTSNNITDESYWYYKNSVDGLWRRWDISVNSETNVAAWKMKWLNQEPKNTLGVIVYLTSVRELPQLNISLLSLRQNLFKPRPIVIFHEGDFNNVNVQLALATTLGTNIPISFEHIRFPTKISIKSKIGDLRLGYNHMCKFFAIMLPYHPLISSTFTFYLRLDYHSYLLGPPLTYDLFDHMQINQFQYAFLMVSTDELKFVRELWVLFQELLNDSCIKPSSAVKKTQITAATGLYSQAVVFNNFEVSNGSLWRNEPRIHAWLRKVDNAQGIYMYRWGDAPIRTLAVTQFLDDNQVVKFRDIGYFHRREYTCSSRMHSCSIPSYHRLASHIVYREGCHPYSNPLCHYYQEKI